MHTDKEASFRELAVLFTDVVNSTEYFKKYGDDKGRKMLKLHVDLVSPQIFAFGGFLLKTVGDSIMAYFENPSDALKAAISIQQKLEEFRVGKTEEDKIHIRIGIDYGKTIMEEKDIFGDVVNIASRLTDLSDIDGILISENVFKRVKNLSHVSFSEFPDSKNIQILKEIPVYRVIWDKEAIFEHGKRIGVLLNFLPPLTGEKGREILLAKRETEPSFLESVNLLRDDLILVIPKRNTSIPSCIEEIRSAFFSYCLKNNVKDFFPLRIVVDVFSSNGPINSECPPIPWNRMGQGDVFISEQAGELIGGGVLLEKKAKFTVNEEKTYMKAIWLSEKITFPSEGEFREIFLHGENKPCFYCGDRRHKVSDCPSKKIIELNPRIEEIGYTSDEEINRTFFNYLTCGTKNVEEIEMVKESKYYELFTKIHFAFFEPKKIFQLRFLRSVIDRQTTEWEELKKPKETNRKGGLLWIALDSIRVSDYRGAFEALKKAEDEEKDVFATSCVKGFYYMEREEEESAKNSFYMALKHAKTKAEKIYALFLLMRLSYVNGDTRRTADLLREIFNLSYDSVDARYFDLIFRLYNSRFFEKEKEMYIKKLIRLIEIHREYFIYALTDPELASFSLKILSELKGLTLKTQKGAEELLSEAEELYASTTPLLLAEERKEISANIEAAKKMREKNGYFALLDSKDMCRRILEKLAVIRKKRVEEIESIREILKRRIGLVKTFIDEYPYEIFIKRARTEMQKIIERFHRLESTNSFSVLREEKNRIEADIALLEKRLRRAEETLYWIKIIGRFLKMCSLFVLTVSVLDFLVFPFFSDQFQKIISYDFVQFQKTFFVGGFLLSLMISFYFAVQKVNK